MQHDTIVAIATPVGYGGIGIVRISGTKALPLLLAHTTCTEYIPWKLQRTYFVQKNNDEEKILPNSTTCEENNNTIIDDILAVYMPSPNTFTGEDVVELHCHGSPVVLQLVIEILLFSGARHAERGEFSKRALFNNRISLSQAEAILEVIHAPDKVALAFAQKRLQGGLGEYIAIVQECLNTARMELYMALDFPEEDLESLDTVKIHTNLVKAQEYIGKILQKYQQNKVWQEGATVLLAGRVNAGKSSIFNAILGKKRAIVSEVEGTTRDYVTERISLHGIPITLMDTAGLRVTKDSIEKEGIEATKEYAHTADSILFILDSTQNSLNQEEIDFLQIHQESIILVYNKIDALDVHISNRENNTILVDTVLAGSVFPTVYCSAINDMGIDSLLEQVYMHLSKNSTVGAEYTAIMPNARQYQSLHKAYADLQQLQRELSEGQPLDAVISILEQCSKTLEEITGYAMPEELLNAIFENFCIGK